MVNVVVDFVEAAGSDASVKVISNLNSNHAKAEVARGAMDVKQNVELVLDLSLYSIGEGVVSGSGYS
jgi:hypothetical protein